MKPTLLAFIGLIGFWAGGIPAALALEPPMEPTLCDAVRDKVESWRGCPERYCVRGNMILNPATSDAGEEVFCRLTIETTDPLMLEADGIELWAYDATGSYDVIGSHLSRHESAEGPTIAIGHDIVDAETFNSYETLFLLRYIGDDSEKVGVLQASSVTLMAPLGETPLLPDGTTTRADPDVTTDRRPITSGVTFRSDIPVADSNDQTFSANAEGNCQLNPLAAPQGLAWSLILAGCLVWTCRRRKQ